MALLRTPRFEKLALVQQSNRGADVYARDPPVLGTAFRIGCAGSADVSRAANAQGQPCLLLRGSCSHRPLPGRDASIRWIYSTPKLFHHRSANDPYCRDRRLRPRDMLGTASTSLLRVPVDVIYIGQRQPRQPSSSTVIFMEQLDQFLAAGLILPWPRRTYRHHPRAVRAPAQVQPRAAPVQGLTRRN